MRYAPTPASLDAFGVVPPPFTDFRALKEFVNQKIPTMEELGMMECQLEGDERRAHIEAVTEAIAEALKRLAVAGKPSSTAHLFLMAFGEGWETFWRHHYFEQNAADCPIEVLALCKRIIAEG